MVTEFVHPQLGQEVQTHGGYYIPSEEHILHYNGREVICVLGQAVIEASCCGTGAWSYIQVPGFLVKRNIRHVGGDSPPVSEVETIKNEADRNRIRASLLEKHPGTRIEIW